MEKRWDEIDVMILSGFSLPVVTLFNDYSFCLTICLIRAYNFVDLQK